MWPGMAVDAAALLAIGYSALGPWGVDRTTVPTLLIGADLLGDAPDIAVPAHGLDPLRVVLGTAAGDRRVHPALEWSGTLEDLLDELGRRGVLQLLVEGGATVAGAFK